MIDAHGRPARVVLLGGSSEIGLAIVEHLPLAPEAEVVLAGRDPARLEHLGARLSHRLHTVRYDATDLDTHEDLIDSIFDGGDVDVVISAAGVLLPQEQLDERPELAGRLVETNFTGHVVTLLAAARHLRRQGHGTLVVLSSIAAVRPRKANFVYGAAKAGLDAFARGLADSLAGSGAQVMVVRPGFVVGRMTAGMDPAPFATTPEQVGAAVAAGYAAGAGTVWVPKGLALVAGAMRVVPRPVWRRLSR